MRYAKRLWINRVQKQIGRGNTTLPEVCRLTFFNISQMLLGMQKISQLVVFVLPRPRRLFSFGDAAKCGLRNFSTV